MSYLEKHGTRTTPQSEKIPGSTQVPNSAGGFAWSVDGWTRLRRFLILGSEGGSYYASERDLTRQNVDNLRALVAEDGIRFVDMILAISDGGHAPSNDPALYALAVAISHGDKATKRYAAEALPEVARIGTHLYHFLSYVETQRGWGRTLRWAVANWYLSKPVEKLAYDAIKYRQRDGWSHRDVLRTAHPKAIGRLVRAPDSVERAQVFDWITHGIDKTPPDVLARNVLDGFLVFEQVSPARIINGFEQAQRATTPAQTAALVREYGLPREALNTDHLTDPEVWRALLDVGMPLGALTRNLANMTRIGVLEGDYRNLVVNALGNAEQIKWSRLHPLAILVAQATYAQGRGMRGTNTWTPIPTIIDALNDAFYIAFGNVETTGKRILLALDVSGSMTSGSVAGSPLTPRDASAALALVALNTEPNCEVVGFTSGSSYSGNWRQNTALTPLGLSARQRLDDAVRTVSNLPFGGTDCALPMLYAGSEGKQFDAFVVYTDSETWAGSIHPTQALQKYRNEVVPGARLAVVGMVSNDFSIADPNDAGMLDVVGFDTATPQIISDFMAGNV